ncbi:MAG: hypothetical protein RL685_4264 [Pseudomonadota bacterium]|jgi:hypothetical protein
MSYLSPLRLHFSGRFQANVSTVNNDPQHFDNLTFVPSDQQIGNQNGWWNPQGDACWRLVDCRVRAAWLPSGPVTQDEILSCRIADSDRNVPAKLVDLDSMQQMVSTIWGLQVRILGAQGQLLLRGDFKPAAFTDLWPRATPVGGGGGGGDMALGAMYQSVLTDLKWGDVSGSAFLTALESASPDELSIKFNVDGYNMSFGSPGFTYGRVVGTIGPSSAAQPKHFVAGRQFIASPTQPNYAAALNHCVGIVDSTSSQILVDLGNALTTVTPGGAPNDIGDLILSCAITQGPPNCLGTLLSPLDPYGYVLNPDWYETTAGVVSLPVPASAPLSAIQSSVLSMSGPNSFISEWSNGEFVRADSFVYRLSPGGVAQIPIYATQFGQPLSGVSVGFTFDNNQLQPSGVDSQGQPLQVGVPAQALSFPASVVTDGQGTAILAIEGSDPGNPRQFIDGQVYGVRPFINDGSYFDNPNNASNFISVLLWNAFQPGSGAKSTGVHWSDIQPILQQYANLYPVMNRFFNLADRTAVLANARFLNLVFTLPETDPNYMPVTRDLSPAKRKAILSWIANPQGEPPAVSPGGSAGASPGSSAVSSSSAPRVAAARPAAAGKGSVDVSKGGKTAALARRLGHRRSK